MFLQINFLRRSKRQRKTLGNRGERGRILCIDSLLPLLLSNESLEHVLLANLSLVDDETVKGASLFVALMH